MVNECRYSLEFLELAYLAASCVVVPTLRGTHAAREKVEVAHQKSGLKEDIEV